MGGKCMGKKDKKMAKKLDDLYDEQDVIMKKIHKLSKELLASRKEQEAILKKLGWW